MGFGLLFIGYFIAFLMSINPYGWAFQIVGFYIIFRALEKLFEYKHSISRCLIPLVIMTARQALFGIHSLGLLDAMTAVVSILESFWIENLISAVYVALLMVFHFLLLQSIRELALDTEDTAIARLTTRNGYIVGFYFLLNVLTAFLPSGSLKQVLSPITVLASIVYPIFMLYLLYRCYARICAPEDKDMEPKPSRFAFINKRREMQKKADEHMDKLIDKLDKQKEKNKK